MKQLIIVASLYTVRLSILDDVNNYLKHMKLNSNERLADNFYKIRNKLASEYKKLKGGSNKTKFDQREKSITVHTHEIAEVPTGPSTPKHENTGLRIDNSSRQIQLSIFQGG